MKLTIFPSDKGDCCLLTGKDGKRILADGGMPSSFTASVSPQLAKLAKGPGNKKLDVVYVSHIDDDHIGGVLRLMDDLVAWKIHDHKVKKDKSLKIPKVPRPPNVAQIWHNGFRDVVNQNSGAIEDQLAANALTLSGFAGAGPLADAVEEHQDLAQSVRQAVTLSQRIRDGVLGIPLNQPAKGKLLMVRSRKASIEVGGMSVRVIAPFEADLVKLRKDWNAWLSKNREARSKIRARGKADADELASSEASRFLEPLLAEAQDLAVALDAAVQLAAAGDADLKSVSGIERRLRPRTSRRSCSTFRKGRSRSSLRGTATRMMRSKGWITSDCWMAVAFMSTCSRFSTTGRTTI